jgi:accessory colonization factor AcfC
VNHPAPRFYCNLLRPVILTSFGVCLALAAVSAKAADEETARPVLHIYGPHDPLPAMREVADRFEAKNNVKMEITGAATEIWKPAAMKDADIIFSGSELMMEDYGKNLGIVDEKTIQTFYLRPATLLVRENNPNNVKGLKDLLKKNLKVMVVSGTGQSALWEDIVGQLKDAEALNTFRKRIHYTAADTAAAEKYWQAHEDIDVWLTMNAWGKEAPPGAMIVPIEKDLLLYRGLAAAVTTTTTERDLSLKFLKFLNSVQAEKVFKSKGWIKKDSPETAISKLH